MMKNFLLLTIPQKILRKGLTFGEHIYYRYLYSSPKLSNCPVPGKYLIFRGEQSGNTKDEFAFLYPAERVNEKITEADLICEHIFNILGCGPERLSVGGAGYQMIDWHSDYKSRYRWSPTTFYRNIKIGKKEGVDIKIPWELSRFQHLHILGQAYLLSGNKTYSDEIVDQIDDWIRNNPFCFGANWRSAMDVAIRAVNWLVAMEYIAAEDVLSEKFHNVFSASIYEHGKFIRDNLEYAGKWKTNHYLADIAGLFFIAVYCPFFKESEEWREFAYAELHNEIKNQVYSDGCSFESSTAYHRLALEMFYYSALLGKRSGIEFSKAYNEKLKRMFEFSLHCIKPNGKVPQIGDNDNGRFLTFSTRHVLDHRYLLSFGSLYFDDSEFKLKELDFDEEAFWIFGQKGIESYDKLPFRNSPVQSKAFPDAGWYIIRDNKNYCFVSCGPNGGDGWHSHNDKLSFEMVINGQDVIVDPGTYVYTSCPEERNKFRSTEYHNTIKFDGIEQNEIPEKVMFSLPDKVRILNTRLINDDDKITFQGEIHYRDFIHNRMITLNKKAADWQITDNISFAEPVCGMLIFHLSPEIAVDGNVLLTKDGLKKIASLEVQDCVLENGDYDYSPEFGVKLGAPRITANFTYTIKNQTIKTKIRKL